MEKRRNTKVIAILALVFGVVGMTVAFAAMSTALTINGTGVMQTATWNVQFVTTSLGQSTTGNASVTTAPTLSATTLGTFDVVLTRPADSVTFTFDVTNTGTIDARISQLLLNANPVTSLTGLTPTCTGLSTIPANATADATLVCNNLTYNITYAGGGAIGINDTLTAGQTRSMVLTLSFGGTQLPTDDVNITGLGVTINYVQQ